MSKNYQLVEALEIYHENGLDEIISEKPQNHFLEKKSVSVAPKAAPEKAPATTEKSTQVEKIQKISTTPTFINHFSSTPDALSALAKKSQNLQQAQQLEPTSSLSAISLKEIVAKAKKAAQAAQNLAELRQAVENFDGCNLKKMATNTVFSDGNTNAKIMLIGEAPGNNEDLQGIPFCGDSGKVLDAMFKAIDMTRADNFYITNTIFWRPPGNRKPTQEELAICRPFVERHIELMKPSVIVLIGATAIESVLESSEPISKIRGKLMDFAPDFLSQPTKTFAIFHPSYLMRQPSKKKVAWLDMLNLQKFLAKL